MRIRKVHSELREAVAVYDGRRDAVKSPDAVLACVAPIIGSEPIEVFGVLLLDGQHRPTGWHEVSRGTLTASLVHPREVFGPVLRLGAAGIILTHNHPSGDPTPSEADIQVTERLVECGALLGVPVLDHIIVGDEGRYRSARHERWGGIR